MSNVRRIVRVGLVALTGACLDDHDPLAPLHTISTPTVPTAIVSDPRTAPLGYAAARSAPAATQAEVVYVSLQPEVEPSGGVATVRNLRTGSRVPVAMADGGFDPVRTDARAGDTVAIDIGLIGGGERTISLAVAPRLRPVVVRTDPAPGKKDVPLNTSILAVFSEPVSPGSIDGIQLLRGGAPVSGTTTLSADGLRAVFQPDGLLAPNTEYVISIPASIADLSGDPLQQPVAVEFTTGTTIIAASVATAQPALTTNPFNGTLRTFAMSAVRDGNGGVSGTFSIFYPASGARVFGRVTCFTIVGGTAAWVAGVAEGANDTTAIGQEYGWRAVDNASPGSAAADQLSLADPLSSDTLGTAQDFCAKTPITADLALYSLIGGDIVVNGSGPPPPPPPATSEIAYAAWPNGGIQVVHANGLDGRVLTSDSGDFSPSWSPDGTKIAFDRYNRAKSGRDIYVINADGAALKRLTNDGFDDNDPAWSPDGRKIAFGRGGAIYAMNATDGSGLTALTTGGFDWHPTWSPDGQRIAFGSDRTGINAIYVMNADGSGLRLLRSDPAGDFVPWWSPDGNWIAFEIGTAGANVVHLIHPDGTGLTWFAVGRTPSWSPDGRIIVYQQFGLHLLSVDGLGTGRVGNGYDPAWSPHGSVPSLGPPTPAEPAQLGATARVDTIALVWTDQANNETGFRIERRSSAPGDSAFTVIATIGPQTETPPRPVSYTDGGLSSSTTYTYRVRAFNSAGQSSPTNEASATPVAPIPPMVPTAVAAGGLHTCATTTAGQAFCWGSNDDGRLGDGTNVSRTTPFPVSGGLSFGTIAAGGQHTCGLATSGAAYCWGSNTFGQLGNGSSTDTPIPVAVSGSSNFISLALGGAHTCGLAGSGAAYCWGWNAYGQLGNGSATNSATPLPVSGALTFESVGTGLYHTCGLTTSGAADCWGDNEWGQLGNGSTTSSVAPVPVSGGLTFITLAVGSLHTCGLTASGVAYCWGSNSFGQLGDGSTTSSSAPVAVSTGLTFTAVAAGNLHTCGLTTTGTAYCWGSNSDGQLGDGSTVDRQLPIAVSGGLSFTALTTFHRHTCALTSGGTAYCWGNNSRGQLGDGSLTSSAVPVKVAGQP